MDKENDIGLCNVIRESCFSTLLSVLRLHSNVEVDLSRYLDSSSPFLKDDLSTGEVSALSPTQATKCVKKSLNICTVRFSKGPEPTFPAWKVDKQSVVMRLAMRTFMSMRQELMGLSTSFSKRESLRGCWKDVPAGRRMPVPSMRNLLSSGSSSVGICVSCSFPFLVLILTF